VIISPILLLCGIILGSEIPLIRGGGGSAVCPRDEVVIVVLESPLVVICKFVEETVSSPICFFE